MILFKLFSYLKRFKYADQIRFMDIQTDYTPSMEVWTNNASLQKRIELYAKELGLGYELKARLGVIYLREIPRQTY